MIPNYLLIARLGMIDTLGALILPHIASAFAIMLLAQSMRSFPTEVVEAARIDGATHWEVLWHVIVPNLRGTIASLAILIFITTWNEYFWPLLLTPIRRELGSADRAADVHLVGRHAMGTAHGCLDHGQFANPPHLPAAAAAGHRLLHEIRTPLMTQTRLIPLNGAFNLRDLGGYPATVGETAWRRVLRADSLHRLTSAEMGELRRLGCTTVIDLRNQDEVTAQPNPFSAIEGPVAYFNISLFGGLDPTRSSVMEADDALLALYCAALDDCAPTFAEVLRLIAEAPGLVVFHCTAGKDRTGMIAAFLLLLAGTPRDRIVTDYALTAAQAPAMFAALKTEIEAAGRDFDHASPMLLSEAATMEAFLDHLEAVHGGAETYLLACGLTEAELISLRARMLRPEPEGVA